MSSKSSSWERHFRYSSNRFWEKFNFSGSSHDLLSCYEVRNVFDRGCLFPGLSDAGPNGAAKTAWILCGEEYEEDEKAAREGKCELVFGN